MPTNRRNDKSREATVPRHVVGSRPAAQMIEG